MKRIMFSLAFTGLALPNIAFATNGMDMEGYGPVAAAMGGASMAYDNGTAAMMNNPATMALMANGRRADLAYGYLGPDVYSSKGGVSSHSEADSFSMPAFGWAEKRNGFLYGVGIYGQGGMGTQYSKHSVLSNPGNQTPSPDLENRSEVSVGRVIFPLAYDVTPDLRVGGSLDFVWAGMDLMMGISGSQFGDMVAGLGGSQAYGSASGSLVNGLVATIPTAISNIHWAYFDFSNQNDYTGQANSTGYAGKLGFVYRVNPRLTIGGTYHSKTRLGDLHADQATLSMSADVTASNPWGYPAGTYTLPISGSIAVTGFQWPVTWGLGFAYQATDRLTVAADYKRIDWSGVMKDFKMVFTADNSPGNTALGFSGAVMNATIKQDWDDQNVLMLGGAYRLTDALTLRAGLNVANNPVPDKYENPLFPATIQDHVTAGFGYVLSKASSIDFSVAHAFDTTVTSGFDGVTTSHSQNNWQFLYSYRY